MTSASASTLACDGTGSNVCELVPSGTTPWMSTLSPPMFAAIDVIGATVVTTSSRAPVTEEVDEPRLAATAGSRRRRAPTAMIDDAANRPTDTMSDPSATGWQLHLRRSTVSTDAPWHS